MQGKYPKILVVSAWYPNSLYPAEGDFVRYQSQMMLREGLDISVFHVGLSIRYLLKGIWTEKRSESNIGLNEYLIEAPFWPRNSQWGMDQWQEKTFKYFQSFYAEHGPYDIIHAHTYLGGSIAALIKKKYNLPYIVTLHETDLISQKVPAYHLKAMTSAFSKADQIVAVSSELHESIERYGYQSKVIPNFIDFEKFNIAGEKNSVYTFIYVGDLIPRKNVDLLIEAYKIFAKRYPDTALTIVGDGHEESRLKSMVDDQNINFLGRLDQEAVAKALAHSHCFVLPSVTETFGIVLVEALACGLPVIATDSGGPKDIVDDSNGILVKQEDKIALLDALSRIYTQRDDYNDDVLRSRAMAKYSHKVVTQRYKALYADLL